jgi:hypothetical protein
MNQTRSRQVARLEKVAHAYLKRRQQSAAESDALVLKHAFIKVANLSLLILYGKPKIDEPLLNAWERCRESAAWRACRKKDVGFDEYGRENGTPFDWSAERIAEYFRKYFMPELPGADETEKLDAIFERAPPWLLWFTYGDVCARILGLELPDLSRVSRFARNKMTFFELPPGPFECRPWPDGVNDVFEVARLKKPEDKLMDLTPRGRKRMRRIYERYGVS